MMLKIGDFSRLGQVSVRTLRYYAELDLLHPTWIDPVSGYRYYAVELLARLNTILALKELGLELHEICELLQRNLAQVAVRERLLARSAALQQQITAQQAQCMRIQTCLQRFSLEDSMEFEIVLKSVAEQRIAGVRETVPSLQVIGQHLGAMCAQLNLWLNEQHAAPGGPWLAVYYDPEYVETNLDVEMALPLTGEYADSGRVQVTTLAACEAATLVVHGPYSGLAAAYQRLGRWIDSHGYELAGPIREVYLRDPDSREPGDPVTEIQFPVRRRSQR